MKNRSVLLGAAFLMATSSIGPGFLTQTTHYTSTLMASFGFVILVSIILDIGAQLNVWRIVTVSKLRAQDVANSVFPGLGHLLTFLIVIGGLVFNIGNVAGAGLGLHLLFDISVIQASLISGLIAISVFFSRNANKCLDKFTIFAGFAMVGLTLYIVFSSHPPMGHALKETFVPKVIDVTSIVTLVGGSVGGYIMFSGAHRLLDANIKGKENVGQVTKSAVTGIIVAGIMRTVLFLAAIGVIYQGAKLDAGNPAASVFEFALGELGLKFFGVVIWVAAMSSIIGAAYTSVSFLRSLNSFFHNHYNFVTIIFILISTIVFVVLGQTPSSILIFAGTLNGWVLPISLTIMLLAAYNKKIIGDYQHPKWMAAFGVIIALASGIMAVMSIIKLISTAIGN